MSPSPSPSPARLTLLAALLTLASCEAIAGYSSREPWPAEGDALTLDALDALESPDSPACPTGTERCGGACVDTRADARHCGGCGLACATGEYCNGASKCTCRPGLTACAPDGCVDPKSDPRHCGVCATVCAAGDACSGGWCRSRCFGTADACALGGGFACTDVHAADPLDCGACGVRCGGAQVCAKSACRDAAPAAGCVACPCAQCATILGQPATCCPALLGHASPSCVAGDACP
jgi:hypothetical protein